MRISRHLALINSIGDPALIGVKFRMLFIFRSKDPAMIGEKA